MAAPNISTDDGFDDEEPVRTPLDASPPVQVVARGSKPAKNGAGAGERTPAIPEGYEQTTVKKTVRPAPASARPTPQEPVVPPESQNPFDLFADVEGGQIEVERIGPTTGPGWKGKKFRGQMPHYCRMGKIPKSATMFDDAQKRWGGGEYKFSGFGTDGRPRIFTKVLPGAPLPPDNIDEDEEAAYAADETDEADARLRAIRENLEQERNPFDPDEQGFVRTREEVQVGTGETGWAFMHAVNAWKWLGPGRAPGPPPPLPGQQPGFQQHVFNPSAFDHSKDGEVADLKETVKQLVERLNQPKSDPMDSWIRMQQQKLDADKLQWDKDREERKADREREREERQAERDREREERQRQHDRDAAAAKIAADAAIKVAEVNANQAAAAAKLQADNWKMMLDANKNSDPFSAMKKMAEMIPLFGGNKEESDAKVIADAVTDAVEKVPDAIRAFRETQAPAPASGPTPTGADPRAFAAAQAQMDNFRLLGSLIASFQEGTHPDDMPYTIKVACSTLGMNYRKVFGMISLATPDIIAGELEKQIAGKQVSPETRAQVDHAKGLVTSAEGRAWYGEVQAAVRRAQAAAQQAQQQVPQQPASQVAAGPAAPAHPLAPQPGAPPATSAPAASHPFATPGA